MSNNVIGQVAGGEKKILDNVHTVADVKRSLNVSEGYTAAINGDPAEDNDDVSDGDFVSLSKAVKGGRA